MKNKPRSLVTKLILALLLTLIAPCIAFSAFYLPKMNQEHVQRYTAIVADSMNMMNNALEKRLSDLSLYAQSISAESRVADLLRYNSETRDYLIIESLNQKVLPSLAHFAAVSADVAQAVLLHKNAAIPDVYYKVYCDEAAVERIAADIRSGACQRYGEQNLYYSPVHPLRRYHNSRYADANGPAQVISFYYPVYSLFHDAVLGVLAFDLDLRRLFSGMLPLLTVEGSAIEVVDACGQAVYATAAADGEAFVPAEANAPALVRRGGRAYYRFARALPIEGLYCVSYLPQAAIEAGRNQTQNAYFALLAALFAATALVLWRIAHVLSRDLIWLRNRVVDISNGDLHVDTRIAGRDEVSQLGDMIYVMEEKTRNLLDETAKLGEAERRAVYAGLVNQLKPHFLCNALNAVRISSAKQGAGQVANALELIINYFRYNMSDQDVYVSLKRELENASDTIRLYNILRGGPGDAIGLQVVYREYISGQYLDNVMVLKYVLQPLIENAVKHGLGRAPGGRIAVEVSAQGDVLSLCVEDDGAGMPAGQLAAVRERLAAEDLDCGINRTEHVGLGNLYHRLRIRFKESAGLEIQSHPAVGTRVIIRMPLLLGDRDRGTGGGCLAHPDR